MVEPGSYIGYAVVGFPKNVSQALALDQYLNGINIALYAKQKADKEFETSIADVLNYYDERVNCDFTQGNLVSFEPKEDTPIDRQTEKLWRKVMANIKINE